MREVVVLIPSFEGKQNIEIDVSINGKKKILKYRVEIIEFDGEDVSTVDKVSVLKRAIKEHDKDWTLVEIGIPTEKNIPIMFRKKQLSETD